MMTAMAIIGHRQTGTGEAGRKARAARANARASELAPIISELRAGGVTSSRAIATELNARGIPTPTGRGTWQAAQMCAGCWRGLA
jgi:hypothetical protein